MASIPCSFPSPGERVTSPASPSPSFHSRPPSLRRLSSHTSASNPTSTPARPESPSWHFPGPSSKYHVREKPKRHTRFSSTVTTPLGPVLSTERRAHRRTQSAAQNPAQRFSPPASAARSRQSSISRLGYSASMMTEHRSPKTPVKGSPAHFAFDARLQDSPFSDYFTDDARSTFAPPTPGGPAKYNAPSEDVQELLVRLGRLQSQLMRSGSLEKQAVDIVRAGVEQIDRELDALYDQSRRDLRLKDSGLFLEEEEEQQATDQAAMDEVQEEVVLNGTAGSVTDSIIEEEAEEADGDSRSEPLAQAQHILENVTLAQEELRKRYTVVVDQNDQQATELEERDHTIEQLQSENEALRTDLGFDHSELLFLKLQMNALEMELEELADNDYRIVHVHKNGRLETKRAKSESIIQTMNRWRQDWHDVDLRLRRRRSQYRPRSFVANERSFDADINGREVDGEGDWRIETVKEGKERVSSITVRRVDRDQSRRFDFTSNGKSEGDLPMYTNQGCQTPPDATPKAEYMQHGCQTEVTLEPHEDIYSSLMPAVTVETKVRYYDQDESASNIEPYQEVETGAEVEDKDEDECAITTSSNTEQNSPLLQPQEPQTPGRKSAWAELWHGLSQLAGTGPLDDEEEA